MSHVRYRKYSVCLGLASLTLVLTACEAPLELNGVNAQLAQPTRRSDLFQASARYNNTVVTVGGMGTIVQSDDSGVNWYRTQLPGKPFLVDITACPDGSFHAIEKTDGIWSRQNGNNWSRQALPEMTEPQAMTCDEENVIWVTGGFSTIIHSGDSGAHWETWSLDEDFYLTTIQFVDHQHGIASGEFGNVLLTKDAGMSWQRAIDLPGSFYPQSAYFSSLEKGWVVGLNGTIWETDDGAQSWQQSASGTTIPLYGISGFGNTLVAVGDNTTILYYRMGDTAWSRLDGVVKSRTYLRGVIALDKNHFITTGGGGTLFSIDVPASNQPLNPGPENE